jgi:hypothetical protein
LKEKRVVGCRLQIGKKLISLHYLCALNIVLSKTPAGLLRSGGRGVRFHDALQIFAFLLHMPANYVELLAVRRIRGKEARRSLFWFRGPLLSLSPAPGPPFYGVYTPPVPE